MADQNNNGLAGSNLNNGANPGSVVTAPKQARVEIPQNQTPPTTSGEPAQVGYGSQNYSNNQPNQNVAQQNWSNNTTPNSQPQPAPQATANPQPNINQPNINQQQPKSQSQPQQSQTNNQYYNNVQQSVSENQYFDVQPNNNQTKPQPTKNKNRLNFNGKGLFKKLTDFLVHRWWLVLILVVAIALSSLGFYAFQLSQNSQVESYQNVEAFIEAPTTSSSGSPVRWKVRVVNRNNVSIQNIEVQLNFDRTFRYTKPINPDPSDSSGSLYKLSSLSAVGQGTNEAIIQFEGVLSGNIDEEAVMSGDVSYIPTPNIGKSDQRFSVPIQAERTRITSPQIGITMTPTQREVQNGSEAEIAVVFENTSETELKDLRVRMTYPDRGGFSYTSSELVLGNTADVITTPDDGNNTWFINSLPRLRTQTLKTRGIVQGADGVKLNFLVEIDTLGADGTYETLRSTTTDVVVLSQPLVLTTEFEGKNADKTFEPGETITYAINYQNKSTRTLTNIEILGFIDDNANLLDFTTLAYVGGTQGDLNNGAVQWTARGVPQLENLPPQSRGKLSFSVQLKDDDAFKNTSLPQNTYTLRPRAEAKSAELSSIQFSGEEYKASGELEFVQELKSEETDNNRAIAEVTWILKSRQTRINDVKVEAISTLPPSSWKVDGISPEGQFDNISYNPVNGKIEWNPGAIPEYSGNGKEEVKITFTFDVQAQENQSLARTELFGEPIITGVDDYTGEKYDLTGNPLTALK